MIRKPDYERGRIFISPILGCNAQCHFCYIYDKGYTTKAVKNGFDIEQVIIYLNSHESFKLGKDGSIISIGAWGDPFPRYNKSLCYHTINWLKKLADLGNPIQIMSRYELHPEILEEIVNLNKYYGHIMYSTSISSIENFRVIEPYSDTPNKRLTSVSILNNAGIATNVMIKPFIQGITDLEVDQIAEALSVYGIKQCVVGDLLLDDTIKSKLISDGLLATDNVGKLEQQVLDCTSGETYELKTSVEMNNFSHALSLLGIKVFKKSSCVNSFILGKPNPANYIESDPNGYCIKCGVCE
ncbi:radical SAM protein [Vibrio cholerae]|nr:radical SAM protein [Vibrio cholerae]EKG0023082.1 radical SAM protein [Vibrio cholerae]ELE5865585.1 radical SAM protein [Vibrio cholerae]ELG7081576.1 radical SAM protein [Vibrio cholerae]